MKRIVQIAAAGVVALTMASCGGSSSPAAKTETASPKPAAPAIPTEIQSAAESALGSETQVLAYGDLAKSGRQQILAANRLKVTPQGTVPGTLVTRAAVIEQDGGAWKEIFRCDENLKNTNGFLGGTPLASVPAWRLQFEQDPVKGLQMYFTPLEKPQGGYITTIAVRWNPKMKRYGSLDRNYEEFLGEVPALETPERPIR
jgi:hypothetical protein